MKPAEVIKLGNTAPISVTKTDKAEDPKIIKMAKIAIILADKEVDDMTKYLCVKAGLRMGYYTEEEAAQLYAFRDELIDYAESTDSNEQ